MVSTRTSVGSIGVLANHAPLMAILDPTELRLYKSGSENLDSGDAEVFAQGEGYLQVIDNSALLIVEEAIPPDELDRSNLETKLEEAQERLERARKDAPGGRHGTGLATPEHREESEELRRAEAAVKRYETFLEIAGSGQSQPSRPAAPPPRPRTPDLEVQVGAGREAGGADVADPRALADAGPAARADAVEVRVPGGHAAAVRDHDEVAVAAGVVAGADHAARARGDDRRPVAGGEVDAGVEAVAARPEAVAARAGDRPAERERGRGDRALEGGEGGGADHAVGAEPGPGLEALHGRRGPRAEAAVERARREAAPGELELERGHVPAGGARGQRARAVARPPAPPQRPPRLRARRRRRPPARCGPGTSAPRTGARAGVAVDRAAVERRVPAAPPGARPRRAGRPTAATGAATRRPSSTAISVPRLTWAESAAQGAAASPGRGLAGCQPMTRSGSPASLRNERGRGVRTRM